METENKPTPQETNKDEGTPIPVIIENAAEPNIEKTISNTSIPVVNTVPEGEPNIQVEREPSVHEEKEPSKTPSAESVASARESEPKSYSSEENLRSPSQSENIPTEDTSVSSQDQKSSELQSAAQSLEQNVEPLQPVPPAHPVPPVDHNKKYDPYQRNQSCSEKIHPLHIERRNRNDSDIFSLKDDPSCSTSIFSIRGVPSKRVIRHREPAPNNIFPTSNVRAHVEIPTGPIRDRNNYHNVKRPSSSVRNPLTGQGFESNDEYKSRTCRKKDGNPVLGVGYPEQAPCTPRVPPGGFSHNLW